MARESRADRRKAEDEEIERIRLERNRAAGRDDDDDDEDDLGEEENADAGGGSEVEGEEKAMPTNETPPAGEDIQLTSDGLFARIDQIVSKGLEPIMAGLAETNRRLDASLAENAELRKAIDDRTDAVDQNSEILDRVEKALAPLAEVHEISKAMQGAYKLDASSSAAPQRGGKPDGNVETISKGTEVDDEVVTAAQMAEAERLITKGLEVRSRTGSRMPELAELVSARNKGELTPAMIGSLSKAIDEAVRLS